MKTMLMVVAVGLVAGGCSAAGADDYTRHGAILNGYSSPSVSRASERFPDPDAGLPASGLWARREPGPYRVVAGETNAVDGPFWRQIEGRVVQVVQGELLVALEDSGKMIFLRNLNAIDDDKISVRAKEQEKREYTTVMGAHKTVWAYDCGRSCGGESRPEWVKWKARLDALLNAEREVSQKQAATAARASEVRDAKVLAWDQERAARGEASGQYALGMRHLAGKGVTNSPAIAREWLTKAAAQGHAKAKAELAGLPR